MTQSPTPSSSVTPSVDASGIAISTSASPSPTPDGWASLPGVDGLPTDVVPHEVYLLLGADTRAGQNGDIVAGTGRKVADVIMLATVASDGSWAYLMSITRDTVLEFPRVKACGEFAGVEERINTSWVAGGALCTVAVVEKLTGLRVDHVAAIDFAGFVMAVDILGGVTVCLSSPIVDDTIGLSLGTGEHRLNGQEALDFARTRKGSTESGGDMGRNLRQQHLMSQLLFEAQNSGLLADPKRAWDTVQALLASMTVDEGLASTKSLIGLLRTLGSVDRSHITTMEYPTTWHPSFEWGRAPLYDQARYALYPLATGQTPPSIGESGADYAPDWMHVTCGA